MSTEWLGGTHHQQDGSEHTLTVTTDNPDYSLYTLVVDGEITSYDTSAPEDSLSASGTRVDGGVWPPGQDTITFTGCISGFGWHVSEPNVTLDGQPVSVSNLPNCEPDPCDGVNCDSGEACHEGECVQIKTDGDDNNGGTRGVSHLQLFVIVLLVAGVAVFAT